MKTALIVEHRGLGREFVRQYRRDGWNVIATARDDASLERRARRRPMRSTSRSPSRSRRSAGSSTASG